MDTLHKLRIVMSDAVPKEGAKFEALSTSLKITHRCGCILVEHFACGKENRRDDDTQESYDRRQAEREYFVELCRQHKKLL